MSKIKLVSSTVLLPVGIRGGLVPGFSLGFLACGSILLVFTLPSLCVSVSAFKFPLFIGTPVILDCSPPTLVQDDLILTNDGCNDPISQKGHTQKNSGLRLQHVTVGRGDIIQFMTPTRTEFRRQGGPSR